MHYDIEVVTGGVQSRTSRHILWSLAEAASALGYAVRASADYKACAPWLVLWGVGRAEYLAAREHHLSIGGRVILWDMGFVGRGKVDGYCRVSIDHDHPWRMLDRTPTDPSRWEHFGIELREDAHPDGHVIIAGMGPKSHMQLQQPDWERATFEAVMARFPGAEIRYRPKPRRQALLAGVPADRSPIEESLVGCRLLICRHSNCAVDAAIAGVPFECEDGAAYWLAQREFTPENRLDFLRRVCWWQWRGCEAAAAWPFLRSMLCES